MNTYNVPRHQYQANLQHDDFPRPELYVDWIEIEGPVSDDWPHNSHKGIFVGSPMRSRNETDYAREVLTRFMNRAWRRPVNEDEVTPYLELFAEVRPDEPSFEQAMKTPLAAVLSSPNFLYLTEPSGTDIPVRTSDDSSDKNVRSAMLTDYQLASRLSYFLWSSMPDEELMQAAKQGQLQDAQSRSAQVDRLLADPKSRELAENFAGQWLKLREVGVNPPVDKIFARYDQHLEDSMRRESEEFFAHILKHDRPVTDFIQSDYVTINQR